MCGSTLNTLACGQGDPKPFNCFLVSSFKKNSKSEKDAAKHLKVSSTEPPATRPFLHQSTSEWVSQHP